MKFKFHLITYAQSNWVKRVLNLIMILIWLIIALLVAEFTNKDPELFLWSGLLIGIYSLGFLKFKPNGMLHADENEILHITRNQTRVWNYKEPNINIELYYYYKNPSINNDLHFLSRLGGIKRYSLFPSKEESEESLDRIVINGERLNIKIRSLREAKMFEEFIDHLHQKVGTIKIFSTKYSDIFNSKGKPFWNLKGEKSL